jgi:O-antigen/teichoic acid export membrane protein
VFASARLLLIGNLTGSAVLFLRNLLVARLIGIEDYGIATTFAMILGMVEMASQLGLHQMIIQDDQGEDPKLQSGLQALHLLRSVVSGLILIVAAGLIADFLNIPDVAWAFQLLALPRIADGLIHFDMYRLQRQHRFWPVTLTENSAFLAGVICVAGVAWLLNDYRVMLFSFVAQYVIKCVVSHMVAERPYRLSLDIPLIKRCFSFGWPLLLNGVVMFMVMNGEKVIVTRELGVGLLALYSMGLTLTMTPGLVLSRTTISLFFPLLSARKHDPAAFRDTVIEIAQASMFAGLVLIAGTALVTTWLLPILLGEKFVGAVALLVPMAVQQAVHIMQGAVSQCSVAKGKTRNALMANVFRISVLPLVWYAATQGASLITLVAIAALGETLGLLAALWLLRRTLLVSLRPLLPSLALAFALFAVLGSQAIWHYADHNLLAWVVPVVTVALFVATAASLQGFLRFAKALRGKNK